MKNNISGFTLIELLVIVLIIGILSSIALPQYQKSVEKSRIAEAVVILNSIQRAFDLCLLSDLEPAECHNFEELVFDMPSAVRNTNCIDNQCFDTKDWQYGLSSSGFYANRVQNDSQRTGNTYPYYLDLVHDGNDEKPIGKIMCINNDSDTCDMICGGSGCYIQ